VLNSSSKVSAPSWLWSSDVKKSFAENCAIVVFANGQGFGRIDLNDNVGAHLRHRRFDQRKVGKRCVDKADVVDGVPTINNVAAFTGANFKRRPSRAANQNVVAGSAIDPWSPVTMIKLASGLPTA